MDIGVLSRDNQVMDMIIKSNIVRELPIYNYLVRATLMDKIDERTGAKALRNSLLNTITGDK